MEHRGKTVFVGLSGGVDSSVAALRLLKEGYDVVGVFIKVWHPDFLVCNWEQERLDAMRVAAHLKIPFLTCDAVEAYRREVGEYFISEYQAGRTPNPDVMCNKSVKFGAFLDFARAHGVDYIATGHYAQKETKDDEYRLLRGLDAGKDQSYFLWTLTQEQLSSVLLPIGRSTKQEIRNEAEKAGIPTAQKKDSQGICFLGHVDIPSFMSNFTELIEGAVLDTEGEVIGSHSGALVYTIGQRHGFTIGNKNADGTPHYVIAKDIAENTITVAPEPPRLKADDRIELVRTNWIKHTPHEGTQLTAQFRYRQTPVPVIVTRITPEACEIVLESASEKPASGQSCVLYANDECMGGGIIAG